MKKYSLLLFLIFKCSLFSYAQLQIYSGFTAQDYVNFFVGTGVTVSNPSIVGNSHSFGAFLTGSNATNLGIQSGIILSSGVVDELDAQPAIGSACGNDLSYDTGTPGDANLTTIAGVSTENAAVLKFDFVPTADTIKFKYVFGSEEYNEYVGMSYNDIFAFMITGPNPSGGNYSNFNIAKLPGSGAPVSINNVNENDNSQFFINNENLNGQSVVFDGFTVVLTAWAIVVPCSTYSFKIAIADAADEIVDSGVFLEQNSFSSVGVSVDNNYEHPTTIGTYILEDGCNDLTFCVNLQQPQNTNKVLDYQILGSATNGVDYQTLPGSITIPAGQISACQSIVPILDALNEGTEFIKLKFTSFMGCGIPNDTLIYELRDHNPPVIQVSNDTAFCKGDVLLDVNVVEGIAPFQYLWSTGITTPYDTVYTEVDTVFFISVTDFCGLSSSDSVTATIVPPYAEAGADKEICYGENVVLTANNADSYIWSNGAITQSITVSPSSTTMYYVSVTAPCFAFDSVLVSVLDPPIVNITGKTEICAGDSLILTASGATHYKWSSSPQVSHFNILQADSSEVLTFPIISTNFTVIGSYDSGCSDTANLLINAVPIPSPSFFTKPLYASSFDPTFHFYDNTQGNNTQWEWMLGDGTTAVGQEFLHTFPVDQFGEYDVFLIVTNEAGCFDTLKSTVLVRADYTLYIPSAFSPNGDGHNDFFTIYGLNMMDDNFSIQIFDRWGKQVFYSTEPAFRWDGKMDDRVLGQDVFNYILKYTAPDGVKYEKRGTLTLIGERKRR